MADDDDDEDDDDGGYEEGKTEGSSSSIHFATDNNCSGTVLNLNSLLGKKPETPTDFT